MPDNTKQEERLQFLKDCLNIFQLRMQKDEGIDILFDEDLGGVCTEINSYYWHFISMIKDEKNLMNKNGEDSPTNANIYKIISATEYSIIRLQPIQGSQSREFNARLAFFVSFYFYRHWFADEISEKTDFLENPNLREIWEKFTQDRLTWLMNFDETNSFPFFLNSQVWMLFDIITRGNIAI
ncbi:hypothetical protein VB796_04405 [Arcicella sp. LKC2W]|uniref:hypothetical protein n=1 Tax=Arcicella sp. LKC2W TaxID=2984198 RepID=UPI002B1E92AD|nr:hypothetical protein [Arcicella sp. LKC2W]MEA5458263.1 hypothetical protein [Arcicella sp. LKC2W]